MELTLKEIKELLLNEGGKNIPVEIGKKYFFRTITYHTTGVVVGVENGFVKLNQAAWIADSGRWADAVKNEIYGEVEPYPDNKNVYVNIDSIVDFHEISELPREQK